MTTNPLYQEIDKLNKQVTFLKMELQQAEDTEDLYRKENIKLRVLKSQIDENSKAIVDYEAKECSCGFPQSYPIPHEHDLTEREKQIINALQLQNKELYEALLSALGSLVALGIKDRSWGNEIMENITKAIVNYEARNGK